MWVALFLSLLGFCLAGSPCPPRENIYPCSCSAVPMSKNVLFTIVTCHRLPSTDALNRIYPTLKTMNIDNFYLYDSFWEADSLESKGEDRRVSTALNPFMRGGFTTKPLYFNSRQLNFIPEIL